MMSPWAAGRPVFPNQNLLFHRAMEIQGQLQGFQGQGRPSVIQSNNLFNSQTLNQIIINNYKTAAAERLSLLNNKTEIPDGDSS